MRSPRVAFFTDSFHEVNGVARTSRMFARYASEQGLPFFSVHTGPETRNFTEGSVETHEIKHSRWTMQLETDLAFDVLFVRHRVRLLKALQKFKPDLLHVTGPGHCGLLGALLALQLDIPLVASWHTNVHEFGARRLFRVLRFLPGPLRRFATFVAEQISLGIVLWLYKSAGLLFAPNPELVGMLHARTGLPTFLMQRGIDTGLFSPARRTRTDDEFVIGYVGRLSPEKNVRLLVEIEQRLIAKGMDNYRFLIVGDGGDREYLSANLKRCSMPGVLLGTELAAAYANMDVFVFPSETDTFGNVVLEAMSSGVPTVVSSGGGPKYIIRPGIDGFEASDSLSFADAILALHRDAALHQTMSEAARAGAAKFSWSAVFAGIYTQYDRFLQSTAHPSPAPKTGRKTFISSPAA